LIDSMLGEGLRDAFAESLIRNQQVGGSNPLAGSS